jgi:hypothetical protein
MLALVIAHGDLYHFGDNGTLFVLHTAECLDCHYEDFAYFNMKHVDTEDHVHGAFCPECNSGRIRITTYDTKPFKGNK